MIRPNRSLRLTALGIGFFFLYAPIISLMAYSFNESQLVTVWTRFSLKWYKALFNDSQAASSSSWSWKSALYHFSENRVHTVTSCDSLNEYAIRLMIGA